MGGLVVWGTGRLSYLEEEWWTKLSGSLGLGSWKVVRKMVTLPLGQVFRKDGRMQSWLWMHVSSSPLSCSQRGPALFRVLCVCVSVLGLCLRSPSLAHGEARIEVWLNMCLPLPRLYLCCVALYLYMYIHMYVYIPLFLWWCMEEHSSGTSFPELRKQEWHSGALSLAELSCLYNETHATCRWNWMFKSNL